MRKHRLFGTQTVGDVQSRALVLSLITYAYAAETNTSYAPKSILPQYEGFIRVHERKFVDANCQQFPVTGVNTWDLMESGAGVSSYLPRGIDITEYTMQQMAANGLTIIRGFGHGHNVSFPLQISPGKYNERSFQGLDHVLDSAGRNNVKVLLTLADNWPSNMSISGTADSKQTFVLWGNRTDLDSFYTDANVRKMYKQHLKAVVNRVNSINGLKYKDDPAIFAWNLMNEPRCNCFPSDSNVPIDKLPDACKPICTDKVTAWVHEMSSYLKKIDPNHLVTVGSEGFWGRNSALASKFNPGGGVGIYDGRTTWAAMTGSNFTAQHNFSSIDFCAAHYWPDMWTGGHHVDFYKSWIESHAAECEKLGKPFVLEEFGKKTSDQKSLPERHQLFMDVYDSYLSSLLNGTYGGNLRGALMWKWNLSPYTSRGKDSLEVTVDDATFVQLVSPAATAALKALTDEYPASCSKAKIQTPVRGSSTQSPEHASLMASQAFEPQAAGPAESSPVEGPPAEAGPFQAAIAAVMRRDPKEALQEAENAASKVKAVLTAPRGSQQQVVALGSMAGGALQGFVGALKALHNEAVKG
eukprot:jgi/Botrbrau1/2182/Bobra.101_2s0018.2